MFVSKRDRSFLRPDKRDMGSVKMSKAFAFAMRDVVGAKETLDMDDSSSYKRDTGKQQQNKWSK